MTDIIKKISLSILGLYVLTGIALLFWIVVYSGSTDGDTLEHVHSSWLVYNNKIPYNFDFAISLVVLIMVLIIFSQHHLQ